MARLVRYRQAKDDFRKRFTINPRTHCWEWTPTVFRFRVGEYIHNPRRFAVYASGRAIPVNRQIIPGCGNERCVNPEHSLMRHDGTPIPKDAELFLEVDEIMLGSGYLRHKYQRTMDQMRAARRNTLLKIIEVRRHRGKSREIADAVGVGTGFIEAARKLTPREFEEMKVDPYDNGEDPDAYEGLPEDAFLFTPDGIM